MEKRCKKCEKVKALEHFHYANGCKDNRRPECKQCKKEYEQQYYKKNKQSVLESNKLWKKANRDKVIESNRKWKKDNFQKELINNRRYIQENREYINKQRSQQQKKRRDTDSVYRLRRNISCLVKNGYRNSGYSKLSKTQDIVGLPFSDLHMYLESTFIENYGILPEEWGWDDIHIDHIIPISSASSKEDAKSLNYFTNLQLLISVDNITKSNKV